MLSSTRPSLFHRNWITHRHHWAWIEHSARKWARGRLLDVGCGLKPYQGLFTKVDEYIGLDLPSEYDIPRTAEETHARAMMVDVYSSALSLPFISGCFQTVVSFQVLEHVAEPRQMVAEIARVLSPGGHVILMAPQMWHLHEAPHDYFRYTRYGLAYLLEANDLEVVEIHPLGGFMARVGLKFNYLLDGAIRRLGRSLPGLDLAGRFPLTGLNLIFAALDEILPTPLDPINHLAVGRKSDPSDAQPEPGIGS